MKSAAEQRGDALAQLTELGRASVPNAAPLMGIHPHTLRKYIRDGEVTVMMIGARPWVEAAEIERFNREGTLSEAALRRRLAAEEAGKGWVPEGC